MSKKTSLRKVLLPVAILIVAVVVAGGGFLGRGVLEQRKQKRTAITLVDLSRLLRDYSKEHHRYPEMEEADITTFDELCEAAKRKGVPLVDAWGRAFRFESTRRHFLIWSLGRNGKVDRFLGGGRRSGPDVDLIVYDGKFWQLAHGI